MAQDSYRSKRAQKKYDNYDYLSAIEYYENMTELDVAGYRKLAKAYANVNITSKSEYYWGLVVQSDEYTPEDVYAFAAILKMNGKYERAEKWMAKFYELSPEDSRALVWYNKLDVYEKLQNDEGRFVELKNLEMNTENADFGTVYFQDLIVFVSTKEEGVTPIKRTWNWNQLPFLDLYLAEPDTSMELNETAQFLDDLNKKYHDGPAAFTLDGNSMMVTRNNYLGTSSDGVIKLKLIEFKKDEKGNWGKAVPFPFNDKEFSNGHAAYLPDGSGMYFVSDRPGGFGGTDIYVAYKDEFGNWLAPENLGPTINTSGNEMFPFVSEHGHFFFSSDGHVGLGGLDLFVIGKRENGAWTEIYNLGSPINSMKDDFSFVLDSTMTSGYFASNRAGGKGSDDIYSFKVEKPIEFNEVIKGVVVDEGGTEINQTVVYLIGEENEIVDSVISDQSGVFAFNVPPNKEWELMFVKEGYNENFKKVALNPDKDEHVLDVKMVAFVAPEVVTIRSINFDFDKAEIRPDAQKELDIIVDLMNRYPDLVIELGAHTDARGSAEYNEKLSQRRAAASAQYIKERIKNPDNIYGKGYGEYRLLNYCGDGISCEDHMHEKNRRTEFIIRKYGESNVEIVNLSPISFEM